MGKNSFFSSNSFIQARGRLLDLSKPRLMSILNLTPDSFHDGGQNASLNQLLLRAEGDLAAGADILDLGAWSSRPGSPEITAAEEWARLEPALKAIRKNFPDTFISIDTWRASVADRSAAEGADIINDISGGCLDPLMLETAGLTGLPYILMHMRGTSLTMQKLHDYQDVVLDVMQYFRDRISLARKAGIKDIILDPGFGFAKKMTQSYELLARLPELKTLDLPILAGLSRKSMISSLLGTDHAGALNGTTAAHMIALQNGASILRVHDVKEAAQAIKIMETCYQYSS